MSNVKNESAANDEWKKARDELIELIDEFMRLSEDRGEETIAEKVYYFLQPHGIKFGLSTYQDAAAVGLAIFAREPKFSKQMEEIFGIHFKFFCEMLPRIVEFCNNIRNNETNMAHLDKCKLEELSWRDLTTKEILEDQIKYSHKIQYLKELADFEKRVK